MLKFILYSLSLAITQISLASELNPYSCSLNGSYRIAAQHAKVKPEIIDLYERFIVAPKDIKTIEPMQDNIRGAESYKATVLNGNEIFVTYYHFGPDQGRAKACSPYCVRGPIWGEWITHPLPVHVSNFAIIKACYEKHLR